MSKERITVSVDHELVAAAAAAVADGRAESVSGWVNEALAEKAAKDGRLAALAEAVAAYEAEHGVISDDEMVAQRGTDRAAAVAARSGVKRRRSVR